MESWDGQDLANVANLTNATQEWVRLMNLTTTEFGVAPFPPNLIALRSSLENETDLSFPNDTIIIQNAGRTHIGARAIEGVVYGVAVAVALLWAVWWIYMTWSNREFFKPRRQRSPNGGFDARSHLLDNLPANPDFISADTFRNRLASYYPRGETEHELREKDFTLEDITNEDVEAVIELIRRMYELDLEVWSTRNGTKISKEERDALRKKSDAILTEVHSIVGQWRGVTAARPWSQEERDRLAEISDILGLIGPERHGRGEVPAASSVGGDHDASFGTLGE
ncbi:hypothetical protein B0T16DRAFT_414486 [Cercophora newfieldiana]|uniref:Uncharacterized protein n=1 Tax=Cercophora newfieldiana TaxID=92897 RepID=A0AA40CQH6_9PEZI|nr:hypothetical protein B0T16DRAFT_414486 [Cercophora newfieldiana]